MDLLDDIFHYHGDTSIKNYARPAATRLGIEPHDLSLAQELSQTTFCSALCGCAMISPYSSGFLAFRYRYPPACVSFSGVRTARTISLSILRHSATISPKGSRIIEQPLWRWSSSIPMAFEKRT